MGLDQLIGLYQYYQVLSYRFEISAISTTVTDAFTLTAFPLGAEQAPTSNPSFMNTRVLQAQPNAKSLICASGVAANSNQQVVISGLVNKDLGMNKAQYTSEMWVTSASLAILPLEIFSVYLCNPLMVQIMLHPSCLV